MPGLKGPTVANDHQEDGMNACLSNAADRGVQKENENGSFLSLFVSKFAYLSNVQLRPQFLSAEHLKNYVTGVSGTKVVMAHSLGNMVVSSAIADHGMVVDKYFMLNAAVASEAYDGTLWSDAPDALNRLVHDDWRSYTNACWSAKWCESFAGNSGDARTRLKWKDRFAGVLSKTAVWNFYSSGDTANTADGDEVFELRDGTPTSVAGFTSSTGRYAWQKQETHKGRGALDPAGTSWSGWGFRQIEVENGGGDAQYRSYTVNEAANLAQTPGALATNTVFDLTPASMNNPDMDAVTLNAHLAEGIPALSPAAGKTAIFDESRAFNMNTVFKPDDGAWGRNHEDYGTRWLHGDVKDMAYFYTHKLFYKLVKEGALE